MKTCVICKKAIDGYGNNAEPLAKGICCDLCHFTKIIPLRIKEIGEEHKFTLSRIKGEEDEINKTK